MRDILRQFVTIAAMTIIVAPIMKTVNAMSTIQSSPIERAATQHNWLFAVYFVLLLLIALMTWIVWKSGNRVQDEVRKDADARIATADSRAEEAKRGAAEARAESDKANAGLVKSNVEIARLTAEAEKAKAERAEADKQIAIAKADAARAKEGIANAEARSLEASAEVARLQGVVKNAEARRLDAERKLLEMQERINPRHLTAEQANRLTEELTKSAKGEIEIRCPIGTPEAHDFALEVVRVFEASGWKVTFNDRVIITPTPVGLKLWLHTDQPIVAGKSLTETGPDRAFSIINAFKVVGLPIEGQFSHDTPKDGVWLIVGFKS